MNPPFRPRQTDRPAVLALLGISGIVFGILGYGWHAFFSSGGRFLSAALGIAIAAIALALAYAIATERVQHPHIRTTAAAYFFVLFNISALGTTNAMFVMFQSSNIFREQFEQTKVAITQLNEASARALATPDYEKLESRVMVAWGNLKTEIENPALCGQGRVAQQRAQELRDLIPEFRTLANSGNCERNGRLIEAYERQIRELLNRNQLHIESEGLIALRSRIHAQCEQMLEQVKTSEAELSGAYQLQAIKASLYAIASQYSDLRQQLNARRKVPASEAPLQIDTSTVSALGDIGQILPFLFSRLSEVSTYVYVILALLLDLTAIAAFARVLRPGSDPRQRLAASAPRAI